jgi:hypothetical protein
MAVTINASTSAGLVQTADTSGVLQLQTAGTTAVTVDASQNVGIGTTSPQIASGFTNLVVSDTDNGGIIYVDRVSGARGYFYANGTTSVVLGTTAASNVPLTFQTADTERMRIDSSGSLLINTTSNIALSSGTVPLQILQNNNLREAITIKANSSTYNISSINFVNASGTQVGYIQMTASATSYVTSSDYRLKDNIAPMTGALDKVSQLKPVTYTWKQDGSDGQGFIAHELQAVVPDAVTGEKDAVDEKGNPVYQGIDTSFLVATLTAAIQEQQTIINDLKARVETLEAK